MKNLNIKAFGGLFFLVLVLALALFLPAGTLNYWQAWLFLVVWTVSVLAITLYLMKKDPALLERRVAAGPVAEQQKSQQIIQSLASLAFVLMFVVPGLDRRFGWSTVPVVVVILGDILVAFGLYSVFLVFKENTFTSAVIALGAEQKLVSAYFNVDYGEGKARGIFTQNNVATAPIFAQWIEPLKDLGVTTISNRAVGGTDHLSFDAVGIPGFQFIQDPMDYSSRTHHSNQDTYERLQPADLRQLAIVEAIFVYNAAMRDQMMPRKPLPTPELEQKLRAPLEGVYPGAVTTAPAQN